MTLSSQQNLTKQFLDKYAKHPHYKAPKGSTLNAKSWQTEAALRMLLNNLDEEVAEDPENLVVYGGTGQAARSKEALQKIIQCLLDLEADETLLVQSGKAVGVLKTHEKAPRVLIANSNLVPHFATWEHFEELKERGLIMYGQMTAGSWIYIGTQGILQGTYETFAACARKHFEGTLAGTLTVTGGLGGMGGAQPLSVTLNGGTFLGVDIDKSRIEKRLKTRYIDIVTESYDEAVKLVQDAKKDKKALSVGLVGDIGTVLKKLLADGIIPDVVTDQTSAHDPLYGYIPSGYTLESAKKLRDTPDEYRKESLKSMAEHVDTICEMQDKGAIAFDYGNNLREYARQGGAKTPFAYPGFVPAYIRPLFCAGQGPFRWAALSGDPEDIYKTDQALKELFPKNEHLHRWLDKAKEKVAFQGIPCRICWLGLGERDKAGLLFNEMVKDGRLKGPVAIGRDHLDCGSVASPFRETEGMKDGSDAISDWPLLNAMTNVASGATWVSFHHGGGVGMGYSQHAGQVIVADGSDRAKEQLTNVLFNDPALGVLRHKDAGYEIAEKCFEEKGLQF